ncbi:MAG: hypothetical protein NWE92_00370 [Candidatus Bathyarchaeota archaeon]|nr:hypothetical protein [Candidatus Bathyarchaeota archaeon]
MRKMLATIIITILAASCFSTLISQALAQNTETSTPPPLIVRWMRYHGAVTQWGTDNYRGSITVNAKTANVPPPVFKPWVTVDATWSNQPPFPATKPTGEGQYSFVSYNARLVMLLSIRRQDDAIVNVTGLWNIKKVEITTEFNQNGAPINTVREVTPIVTRANGQLCITPDWKQFTLTIDGVDVLQGVETSMTTSTNQISPFSFTASPHPTLADLMHVFGCFRSFPGLGNYNPELDYNNDAKIDLADLTTVAANM